MMVKQGQLNWLLGLSSYRSLLPCDFFTSIPSFFVYIFFISTLSVCCLTHSVFAEELISEPDASHYAFANYLDSGIYRTSG